MNIFTSGYELGTAITNILIFLTSIYAYYKCNCKNKLWKLFFLSMICASLFGTIIHGIVMSENIKLVLWILLSLIFSITINILLTIFLKIYNHKIKNRIGIILTIILYTVIIIEYIVKIDFLDTFIIYACISLLLILMICIKEYINCKDKKYLLFIFGIVSQIIGGIFLIIKTFKFDALMLDKNGLYHIFMVLTVIFFYKGALKK